MAEPSSILAATPRGRRWRNPARTRASPGREKFDEAALAGGLRENGAHGVGFAFGRAAEFIWRSAATLGGRARRVRVTRRRRADSASARKISVIRFSTRDGLATTRLRRHGAAAWRATHALCKPRADASITVDYRARWRDQSRIEARCVELRCTVGGAGGEQASEEFHQIEGHGAVTCNGDNPTGDNLSWRRDGPHATPLGHPLLGSSVKAGETGRRYSRGGRSTTASYAKITVVRTSAE